MARQPADAWIRGEEYEMNTRRIDVRQHGKIILAFAASTVLFWAAISLLF